MCDMQLNPIFEDPVLRCFLERRTKQFEGKTALMPDTLASIKSAAESFTFTSPRNTHTHDNNITTRRDGNSDSRTQASPRLPPSHDLLELLTDTCEQFPASAVLAKAAASPSVAEAEIVLDMNSSNEEELQHEQQSVASSRSSFPRRSIEQQIGQHGRPATTSALAAAILAAQSNAGNVTHKTPSQQPPCYQLNAALPFAHSEDVPSRPQVARERTEGYTVPQLEAPPGNRTTSPPSMTTSTQIVATATPSVPVSHSSDAVTANAWRPASFGESWANRRSAPRAARTQPAAPPQSSTSRSMIAPLSSPPAPAAKPRQKQRNKKKKKKNQHRDRSVGNSGHNSAASPSFRSSTAAFRAFHDGQLQSEASTSRSIREAAFAYEQQLITSPRQAIFLAPSAPVEDDERSPHNFETSSSSDSSSSRGWAHEDRGARNFVDPLAPWNKGVAVFPAHHHDSGPVRTLDQNANFIMAWQDQFDAAMQGMRMEINFNEYKTYMASSVSVRRTLGFDEEHWSRTIVPEYWKPVRFGTESPALFWKNHIASHDPDPLDLNDLVGAQPFWALHPPYAGVFHASDVFGPDNGLDPGETAELEEARTFDRGSNWFAKMWRRNLARQAANRRGAPVPIQTASRPLPPGSSIPRIPLLIRLAQRDDMLKMSTILNHYINNTRTVLSDEECTEEDMKIRWQTCKNKGLPVLVACQPNGHTSNSTPRTRTRSTHVPENVVGFAIATERYLQGRIDFDNKGVEVFVQPQFTGLRVGSSLLDKMLKVINPVYQEKINCELDLHDDNSATSPSTSGLPIKNVFLECLWDADDSAHANRLRVWLCVRQDWDHCGRTSSIGSKGEKAVDMYTYKYSYSRQ